MAQGRALVSAAEAAAYTDNTFRLPLIQIMTVGELLAHVLKLLLLKEHVVPNQIQTLTKTHRSRAHPCPTSQLSPTAKTSAFLSTPAGVLRMSRDTRSP